MLTHEKLSDNHASLLSEIYGPQAGPSAQIKNTFGALAKRRQMELSFQQQRVYMVH